jgi:hypothetical protein
MNKVIWSVIMDYMLILKMYFVSSQYLYDCHIWISAILQEDCKKLKNLRLTPCSHLAIQLRITEKKLLEATKEYVKQRIKTWRDRQVLDNQLCVLFIQKIHCSCVKGSTDT